jgi:hypothetical protein
MFKPIAVGGGRGLGALFQHCLRRGHTGRQVPVIANSNPGGYIKRTSTGGIKFVLKVVGNEKEGGLECVSLSQFG